MAMVGYRVHSSPAALVWAGAILLLALLSLGLVDHHSARQSRARLAAVARDLAWRQIGYAVHAPTRIWAEVGRAA